MTAGREVNPMDSPAASVSGAAQPTTLVIGYGNTLRGDDGVGYQVAEAILDWHLAGVKVLPCHQLTPELAAEIALVQQIVFVDAAIAPATAPPDITVQRLSPDDGVTFTTHAATPSALLALAKWLYHETPVAYQLTIPAINFDMGATLSPTTAAGMALALVQVRKLCTDF